MKLTSDDIGFLLFARSQLQVWHWQTQGFAMHQALGSLYESLDGLTDSLVERDAAGGAVATPSMGPAFQEFRFGVPESFITETLKPFLANLEQKLTTESGLLNIVADMRNAADQALYMLRLR